jgi:hypothetical protein
MARMSIPKGHLGLLLAPKIRPARQFEVLSDRRHVRHRVRGPVSERSGDPTSG